MEILKAGANTAPNSLAGAIAEVVRNDGRAEIQAIGAAAVNQATKGIIIARGFLAPTGIEIVCIPSFAETEINKEPRTVIKLTVESK